MSIRPAAAAARAAAVTSTSKYVPPALDCESFTDATSPSSAVPSTTDAGCGNHGPVVFHVRLVAFQRSVVHAATRKAPALAAIWFRDRTRKRT